MQADGAFGVEVGHVRGDGRADVTALEPIAVIAQRVHQFGEGGGGAPAVPAALARRCGPGEPRDRRRDDVERVPAVGRLGQHRNGVEELVERTRPAVDQHEGQSVGARRTRVDEVDGLPVDLGHGVLERVEALFLLPPVEPVAPPIEKPQVRGLLDPLLPPDVLDPVGQARLGEPVVQVVEYGLRDVHPERLDVEHRPF